MRIAAVIFDFDGVLVDSEPVQIRAWETFLDRYDRSLNANLLNRMFGLRVWDSAALVGAELELSLSVDEIVAERDRAFFELLDDGLPTMPGAHDVLGALQRDPDIQTGLGTSGHQRYIAKALEITGLPAAFDARTTGDEVDRGKPNPDIYSLVAERLGADPAECIVIEDAPNGVEAAIAANMRCVAIPSVHTAEAGSFHGASWTIESLEKLPDLLGELGVSTYQDR